MTKKEKTVVEGLLDIAEQLRHIAQRCGSPGGGQTPSGTPTDVDRLQVFKDAITDTQGREELLLRYTTGTLTFKTANDQYGVRTRYGLLNMKMYKLDGAPDGSHQTVWIPLVSDATTLERIDPPNFTGPFDQPGAIFPVAPRAQSKAVWTFADGSAIYATGPANLLLVPYKDGSKQFVVSVAAVITGGEGAYQGCRGVKTALGSSFVPKGVTDLASISDDQPIGGVTVETFRVIRHAHIR